MADDDIPQQADQVSEKERTPERGSERTSQEAVGSMDELLSRQRAADKDQKDPERLSDLMRAKAASVMLGRPEIFDPNEGKVMLQGMDARSKGKAARDSATSDTPAQGAGSANNPRAEAGDSGKSAIAEGTRNAADQVAGPSADASTGQPGKQFEELLRSAADQVKGGDAPDKADTGSKDTGWEPVDKGDRDAGWQQMEPRTQPSEVRYPDGRTRDFTYDKDGNPTRVTNSDGQSRAWEKNADGTWQRIGQDGKPDGQTAKNLAVDGDGTVRYERPDGSKVTEKPDGTKVTEGQDRSEVHENIQGQVSQVKYADGTTREFEYDENLKLKSVHHPDGTTLERGKEGVWVERGRDGQFTGEVFKGKIDVDRDGNYTRKEAGPGGGTTRESPDGTKTTEKPGHPRVVEEPDGTRTSYHSDNSKVTTRPDKAETRENADGSSITKDPEGKISQVTYPRQKTSDGSAYVSSSREFEYDGKGLSKVHNPDGTSLQRAKDGSWLEFDREGNPTGKKHPVDSVRLDDNGNFTAPTEDGRLQHRADGTKIETFANGISQVDNPDGSRAALENGRPYAVTQPDGRTRYFGYDDKGDLNKISDPSGIVFEKKGDTWHTYSDPIGTKGFPKEPGQILEKFKADVRVDSNGTVRIDGPDKKMTIRTDGKWVDEPAQTRPADAPAGQQARTAQDAPAAGDQPKADTRGKEIQDADDLTDKMRSGFTRHDDPAQIEKARDELWKGLREKGSATDLDLRKIDALNDVLAKARSGKGAGNPDDAYQVGGAPAPPGVPAPPGEVDEPRSHATRRLQDPEYDRQESIKDRERERSSATTSKTDDGGYASADRDGKRTVWADGTVRQENKDGTGYVRKYAGDGSYSERHWGPKAGDNYEVERSRDGETKIRERDQLGSERTVTDRNDPRFKEAERAQQENPRREFERTKLAEQAESRITDPADRERFRQNMQRFETRLEDDYKKKFEAQGKSPEEASRLSREKAGEEIAKTYREVNRLVGPTDNAMALSPEERAKLAEQVIAQAANPNAVDQGASNTCGPAALEHGYYKNNPSVVARMVTDVATTNSYKVNVDGKEYTVVPNIIPDNAARSTQPGADGRTHASQIFQETSIKAYKKVLGELKQPPEDVSYEKGGVGRPPASPTGEYIVTRTADGRERREPFPGLKPSDLTKMSYVLTGERPVNGPQVIARPIEGATREQIENGKRVGVQGVQSPEQLGQTLSELKAQGRLPAVLMVDVRNEPFRSQIPRDQLALLATGGHFVSVTDYHAGPPPKVEIKNQWGRANDLTGDKAVPLEQAYAATGARNAAQPARRR